jgi:hypothetical protein
MTTETKQSSQSRTPASLIAAAWIVVCIPLAWGVYNTAVGAAKLFTHLHAGNPPSQVRPS